jgi:hypothetical protein
MGLSGILAAKLGAASVLLTDYEPLVSLRACAPALLHCCCDDSSYTGAVVMKAVSQVLL